MSSWSEEADLYRQRYPDVTVKWRGLRGLWANFTSQCYRKPKNVRGCTFRAVIGGQKYYATPEHVAQHIIYQLKLLAERQNNVKQGVWNVLITTPAYYNAK